MASVSVVDVAPISGTESRQLLFAAKDAEGDTIALSPGSGIWSLVDGGDNLTLTADGIATGKQSGYANVRVTVDGVVSEIFRVAVQNDPNGDQNMINFDDLDTVDYNAGTPVSEEARLSDRYLNTLGIRFSSTPGYVAVVRLLPNDSPSPFNAISPVSADGLVTYANEDPIVITFFDPKNPTVKGGTKSLAFTSDKDGRATTNMVATAYDALGNVVDTEVVPDTGGAIITVESETANIHSVVITGADGNQDGVSFDDFAFGPVVPVE
ncbi:hypothetical protein EON81_00610 [bacterium]|nr:MAG: hypothetical protein EON81_00610 [bacterium]